jgi:DNA repair protein RecN (Recombination protein N)
VLEIDSFSPSQEDYVRLCIDVKRAEQHERLTTEIDSLNERSGLSEKISADLRFLVKKLGSLKSIFSNETKLDDLIALGESILLNVDDFDFEVSRFISNLQDKTTDSEMSFNDIQARLQRYQELFRKFQVSEIDSFITASEEIRSKLDLHENFIGQISKRIQDIQKHLGNVQKTALSLSRERSKSSKILSEKVTENLRDLAMPKARFVIAVTSREGHNLDNDSEKLLIKLGSICPSSAASLSRILADWTMLNSQGIDDVRFLLSANPGEEPKNLDKVASGGEISRVLLGIKSVFSQGADSCVLVFDEVDTGVSGLEADLIGQKIKKLSLQFQVICISHLAQVAAYADTHFKVEKSMDDNSTRTRIFELSNEEATRELARLVSGKSVTERSLEAARELKKSASFLNLQ